MVIPTLPAQSLYFFKAMAGFGGHRPLKIYKIWKAGLFIYCAVNDEATIMKLN